MDLAYRFSSVSKNEKIHNLMRLWICMVEARGVEQAYPISHHSLPCPMMSHCVRLCSRSISYIVPLDLTVYYQVLWLSSTDVYNEWTGLRVESV